MSWRKFRWVKDGTFFHICNRGVLKKPIFLDDFDYGICEEILSESLEKYQIPIYAYCLMPNHWHLLVKAVTMGDLCRMLHRFSSVHAKTLRRKQQNEGIGAVYQGRYRAHPVQENEALFRVKTYIEENPCKAGLCSKPQEWRWTHAHPKSQHHIRLTPLPSVRGTHLTAGTNPSWQEKIESALFAQRPLGDVFWKNSFLPTSQQTRTLEKLAA